MICSIIRQDWVKNGDGGGGGGGGGVVKTSGGRKVAAAYRSWWGLEEVEMPSGGSAGSDQLRVLLQPNRCSVHRGSLCGYFVEPPSST